MILTSWDIQVGSIFMGKCFIKFEDHNAKATVKGLLEMGCNGANDNDGDPNFFMENLGTADTLSLR